MFDSSSELESFSADGKCTTHWISCRTSAVTIWIYIGSPSVSLLFNLLISTALTLKLNKKDKTKQIFFGLNDIFLELLPQLEICVLNIYLVICFSLMQCKIWSDKTSKYYSQAEEMNWNNPQMGYQSICKFQQPKNLQEYLINQMPTC